MKLKTKLVAILLACGLIPLGTYGVVSYSKARESMSEITKHGSAGLTRATERNLEAQRDARKSQVEAYIGGLQNQIVSMSEDLMVIDLLKDLDHGFHEWKEAAQKDGSLAEARKQLATYYQGEFATEYAKQNSGKTPDTATYLSKLSDESALLQYHYVRANPNPLGQKHLLDRSPVENSYNKAHGEAHPILRKYLERFGLYDIFLMDADDGHVVYTCFKEVDFATCLGNGPTSTTGLAEVWRKANGLKDRSAVLVDFAPYQPSYEAPASFMAAPIYDGEEKIGVIAFQMPLDKISQMMAARSGLGETGETILVGSDYLPRSDSYLDKENRNVVNAFRNPDKGRIKTVATQAVHERGETGVVHMTDYRGKECVVAYTPVNVLGHRWCLNAKMDIEEALAAVAEMSTVSSASQASLACWAFGLFAAAGSVVATTAVWYASSLTRPIVKAAEFAKQIASGNLTATCETKASGECGQLIDAMNNMRSSLRDMIGKLTGNIGVLANSSTQISSTATQLAAGADTTTSESSAVTAAAEEMTASMTTVSSSTHQMTANVESVAAAIEEMTASISDVAQNAERAAGVACEAARLTEISNEKISLLGAAANEIGKVIEVIQDIAEQTNLLALNATIEAARAGEAGKGFAVVATEVKELAKQTSEATDDIARRVKAIQETTGEAVKAIGDIQSVIHNVSSVSSTIASAVAEQQQTTHEIARTVHETTSAVQSVSRGISESAVACREITKNMVRVDQAARETAQGAGHARLAGTELHQIAGELEGLVKQFAV